MELPRVQGRGFLFVGDPHVAAAPPGQRLEGYKDQVVGKLRYCLELAVKLGMVPVLLGDLFHYPRENPNSLLVELMELFRPHTPFVLVGNHDKHQARYTTDVSMAVLQTAGVIRLLTEPGPAFVLDSPQGEVLLGASPDGYPLPRSFKKVGSEQVVWIAHHNISFPDFPDKHERIRAIEGVDWVVNGHIHRPQMTVQAGLTRFANPGNITRLTFSHMSRTRRPAAAVWTPGCQDLERWVVPHLPFEEVFPDQALPEPAEEEGGESLFLAGLERLTWRRTAEGWGLGQFLQSNLNPELPEARLVWELYEEVIGGQSAQSGQSAKSGHDRVED